MFERNFSLVEQDLYEEIINILDWNEKGDTHQLYLGTIPIICGKKKLIKMCEDNVYFDFKNFITFKPLKNSRHCQYLINFLYEQEDDILDIKIIKFDEEDEKRKYQAQVIQKDTLEVMLETDLRDTETEAYFVLFYLWFSTEDETIEEKLKVIKEFDKDWLERHPKVDKNEKTKKKPKSRK